MRYGQPLCRLGMDHPRPPHANRLRPRSVDTLNRERQLAVDFIAAAAGGPTIYLGRDMKVSHKGMGITKADYAAFMRCLSDTLDTFKVPEPERSEVAAFTTSLESEIVEA